MPSLAKYSPPGQTTPPSLGSGTSAGTGRKVVMSGVPGSPGSDGSSSVVMSGVPGSPGSDGSSSVGMLGVPGSPGSDRSSSVVMSEGALVTRVVFNHDVKVVFLELANIKSQAFLVKIKLQI